MEKGDGKVMRKKWPKKVRRREKDRKGGRRNVQI